MSTCNPKGSSPQSIYLPWNFSFLWQSVRRLIGDGRYAQKRANGGRLHFTYPTVLVRTSNLARNIKPRNSGFLLRIAIHLIGRKIRTEENVIETRMFVFQVPEESRR